MTTIADFLLDRIDEAEAINHRILARAGFAKFDGEYVDPHAQRVLAESDASRRIVERAIEAQRAADAWTRERLATDTRSPLPEWARRDAYAEVLRDLAAVYADHPDYREEWRDE